MLEEFEEDGIIPVLNFGLEWRFLQFNYERKQFILFLSSQSAKKQAPKSVH